MDRLSCDADNLVRLLRSSTTLLELTHCSQFDNAVGSGYPFIRDALLITIATLQLSQLRYFLIQ